MTRALLLVDIQNNYFPGGAMELVLAGMKTHCIDTFAQVQAPMSSSRNLARATENPDLATQGAGPVHLSLYRCSSVFIGG